MTDNPQDDMTLTAFQQKLLVMLLPETLHEKALAKRLAPGEPQGAPLTRQLRTLAKRGLVVYIPAPHGSLWCLTQAGREAAQALQQQENIISEETQ